MSIHPFIIASALLILPSALTAPANNGTVRMPLRRAASRPGSVRGLEAAPHANLTNFPKGYVYTIDGTSLPWIFIKLPYSKLEYL